VHSVPERTETRSQKTTGFFYAWATKIFLKQKNSSTSWSCE